MIVCAAALIAAEISRPDIAPKELLAHLAGDGEASARAAGTIRVHCGVRNPLRYPAPGEMRFDCRSISPPLFNLRLSVPHLPWGAARNLSPGSEVLVTANIRPVDDSAGPFSYESYLYRHGIAATGRVEEISIRNQPSTVSRPGIEQRLIEEFGPTSGLAVILAGVLGSRDRLGEELNLLFRRTGISHLIVVSGFHVGILFFSVVFVIRQTLGRSVYFLTLWPIEPVAAAFGLGAAWLCLPIFGVEVSIMRALLALTIFAAAKILCRDQHTPRTMVVVLTLTFLIWPGAFFEAGCQLTFLAIGGLIAAGAVGRVLHPTGIRNIRIRISSHLIACTTTWLFTAPAVMLWFEGFAPLAPVFNIFAVPVFTVVTLLTGGIGVGLYTITPALGRPFIELSLFGTTLFLDMLTFLDDQVAQTSLGYLELASHEAKVTAVIVGILLASGLLVLGCIVPAVKINPQPKDISHRYRSKIQERASLWGYPGAI